MGPEDLHRALSDLPRREVPADVLIGHETFDDAGVVRIAPDLALIQTVDFFTPIVDDPYDYGQIAAANALSDVYAMGGTPRTALNLVCWPPSGLDPEVLGRILAGGTDKIHEAGAVVIGGHSIQDEELKFGYAVTGVAHPDRLLTNAAAAPGDVLVLTKPLGTGILTTALKGGRAGAADLADAVASMKALNDDAARAALESGVRAATDVTGFGLAGHAAQMAEASDVTFAIRVAELPLLDGALERAEPVNEAGGGASNRAYFGAVTAVDGSADERRVQAAWDPQTSGGLLLAVAADGADALLEALREAGVGRARRIGTVEEPGEARVRLLG